MNKKNIVKFSLDAVMVVILALLYNKSSVNITFHEIAGLALFGIFIIHLLFNYKWIIAISRKLFSTKITIRSKFGYVIDFLLLVCFVAIIVSGILISKVVFHFSINSSSAKTIHYFCSAASLILIGIHLGLHTHFLSGIAKRIFPFSKKLVNTIGILLTVILFVYGSYSLTSTSFSRWIFMPFSSSQGQMPQRDFNQEDASERPEMDASKSPDSSIDLDDSLDADVSADSDASGDTDASGDVDASGDNVSNGDQRGPSKGEHIEGGGGMPSDGIQITNILSTFLSFFSIMFVFATITKLVELSITKLFHNKNAKKQSDIPPTA
ncbi:MAG: DUF4405 domain-containing protein [Mobilitalea sp.]